jgi:hypothetical protein
LFAATDVVCVDWLAACSCGLTELVEVVVATEPVPLAEVVEGVIAPAVAAELSNPVVDGIPDSIGFIVFLPNNETKVISESVDD